MANDYEYLRLLQQLHAAAGFPSMRTISGIVRMPLQTVSNYLAGRSVPPRERLQSLADALAATSGRRDLLKPLMKAYDEAQERNRGRLRPRDRTPVSSPQNAVVDLETGEVHMEAAGVSPDALVIAQAVREGMAEVAEAVRGLVELLEERR